jgi:hypothetical protein
MPTSVTLSASLHAPPSVPLVPARMLGERVAPVK